MRRVAWSMEISESVSAIQTQDQKLNPLNCGFNCSASGLVSKKTTVHKNAGSDAKWDETIVLEESLESDVGADAPIGFTAITLRMILSLAIPISAVLKSVAPRSELPIEHQKRIKVLKETTQNAILAQLLSLLLLEPQEMFATKKTAEDVDFHEVNKKEGI
ncbi:hypothetical protein BGZ94_002214 [Podila epigama]|nr:hypothetical protein BGZ94_002214 [Podila epigama]